MGAKGLDNEQTAEASAAQNFFASRCPKCGLELDSSIGVCPNDGFEVSVAPRTGKIFENKYEILSRIGAGGMGVIFKAKQRGLERIVAIKMLTTTNATDVSLQRFQQEAQALAKLDHPNLVKVHELGTTDYGHPFMVMEFVDGKSLDVILKDRGQLTLREFFAVFSQVCQGLQCVHEWGILHRDMKPSNIMVSSSAESNLRVKVVDFGIAKIADSSAAKHLTQTGEVVGSPLYMSPEQAKGAGCDERSDIYALGCVMYEALTGITPFYGASVVEVIMKQVSEKHRPLNSVVRGRKYPNALETMIDKMLEKDPAKRFQSVKELQVELGKLAAEHRNWYHLEVPRLLAQRKRETLLFVVGICLLVFVLAAFITNFGISKQEQTPLNEGFHRLGGLPDERQAAAGKPVQKDWEFTRELENIKSDHSEHIELFKGQSMRESYPLLLADLKERRDRYVTEFSSNGSQNYIDDKVIPCIEDFPLRVLNLDDSQVTAASLPAICSMRTIEVLHIDQMKLSESDCRMLGKLSQLRELSVRSANIDDTRVRILCSHVKLNRLYLDFDPLTDAAIKSLADSQPQMSFLSVEGNANLTDKSIEYISQGMPNMVELSISSNRITDRSLPYLARMNNLRSLKLVFANITDGALSNFRIPALKRLYVASGAFSDKAVQQFLNHNPGCIFCEYDKGRILLWRSKDSKQPTNENE